MEHEKLQVMVGRRQRAPCEAIERILHGLVERCGWEEGRLDGDHLLSVKVISSTGTASLSMRHRHACRCPRAGPWRPGSLSAILRVVNQATSG